MDVWWLIAALIFGLVMGYFCPFRPRPKIKTVGELYILRSQTRLLYSNQKTRS